MTRDEQIATELRTALRHMERAQWRLDQVAPERIDNVMVARTLLAYVALLVQQTIERGEP